MRVIKGHGTENDFVVVPDPDGELDLPPRLVAALCDRRAGIGGDGLIRAVRTAKAPEVAHLAGEAEWFMDYRNADGSVAEMCGNGVRVLARYLAAFAHVGPADPLPIATRGGVRRARFEPDGQITVGMGRPALLDEPVRVGTETGSWDAVGLHIPNPHAVAFVEDLTAVGELRAVPAVEPATAFPDGVNVELVERRGPGAIALRVHERGVGETRSCGTGVCAAAVVAARAAGPGAPSRWSVEVPGGLLAVTLLPDGEVELTGPAVLVATAEVGEGWLAAALA
ncbi:diaminopimelate epimerase [Motilibacter aurantiacus]|uniref:diaminopimelate epimerase n=1 Tax=Motilibacter aurantiacus TaxID=2714955 RepID=UPI001409A1EB|nr:diaminopimelate epimerase [Motilibacter aurantiacus]NHC44539.1 diaminopimelate epimerase [Motilibacter aurantiacus]